MSIDISFGGMSIHDGVHKLPKDCSPPTESDSEDEESFVVLNDPESSFIGVMEAFQPPKDDILSTDSIDRSLNSLNDIAQSVMNKSAFVLQSLPPTSSMSQSNRTEDVSKPDSVNFALINGQELNLTQIQTRVQTFAKENAQLKDAINQNNIAMKEQCEKIAELHLEYVKSTEQEKSKLRDSNNKVEQLQTANDELKFVRDEQKKVIDQLRGDVNLLNKSRDKLKASQEDLYKMSVANMNSFKLESTERKLKETIISLEESVDKAEMLQSELNIFETLSESLKMRHLEEIARLTEKLVYFQEKEENYEQNEIAQQKMTHQLTEMQKKIVEITTGNNDLSTEILVFEQQVKIYKDDFEEERAARQKLKQDEDQLKADLEFTRKLNDELKEANARLKTPNAPNAPPPLQDVSNVPKQCPWCASSYFNNEALHSHIHRCFNNPLNY